MTRVTHIKCSKIPYGENCEKCAWIGRVNDRINERYEAAVDAEIYKNEQRRPIQELPIFAQTMLHDEIIDVYAAIRKQNVSMTPETAAMIRKALFKVADLALKASHYKSMDILTVAQK